MRSKRANAWLLLLAIVLLPTAAHAENIWFAGAGVEFPRPDGLGRLHEEGISVVVGMDRPLGGTTGVMMRVAYSRFPADQATASQAYSQVSDASLATLVGGLRFRRRDLALSPYFDVGLGLGLIDLKIIGMPLNGYLTIDETSTGFVWSWGTGIAWRVGERYGLFVDGHWDTVPEGAKNGSAWTGAVRVGVERR